MILKWSWKKSFLYYNMHTYTYTAYRQNILWISSNSANPKNSLCALCILTSSLRARNVKKSFLFESWFVKRMLMLTFSLAIRTPHAHNAQWIESLVHNGTTQAQQSIIRWSPNVIIIKLARWYVAIILQRAIYLQGVRSISECRKIAKQVWNLQLSPHDKLFEIVRLLHRFLAWTSGWSEPIPKISFIQTPIFPISKVLMYRTPCILVHSHPSAHAD